MLFVGDDWAEGHHDIEIMDASGKKLCATRVSEGVAGVQQLHALIADHGNGGGSDQVFVAIETDRGPWVTALVSAGYRVFAVNPRQAARFRERFALSGAKSDAADAHALADMVRTDSHQLREVAGDSDLSEVIKLLARTHQTLIWDRQRQVARLRAQLRDFFPAALVAFGEDLAAGEVLDLIKRAPDPDVAAKLSRAEVLAALKRAGRKRLVDERAERIHAGLNSAQLRLPAVLQRAYATTVRSTADVIAALVEQINTIEAELVKHLDLHPDAMIYLSQPGMGEIVSSRVLGEFGDDRTRYAGAKARKNYAGTSPVTIASGRRSTVSARHIRNTRLIDALMRQAMCALRSSPGARTYYDRQRARGVPYNAALRHVANRLVGILHGCLATRTVYDEATAWAHQVELAA